MDKETIIKILNEGRAHELGSILQYMGHHYEAEGMESPEIIEIFKKTGIVEMKHAESMAERIVYLGGTPTYIPNKFNKGGDLRQMVEEDLARENVAIEMYKNHIKMCTDDPVTRLMLEKILSDEEEHADEWQTVLGRRK